MQSLSAFLSNTCRITPRLAAMSVVSFMSVTGASLLQARVLTDAPDTVMPRVTVSSSSTAAARTRRAAVKKTPVRLRSPLIRRAPVKPISRRALLSGAILNSSSSVSSVTRVYTKAGCGDKLIINDEQCDDGNALPKDGCSATCTIETGFECTKSQPSNCWSTCGDGVVATDEKCDDRNRANDDGCSSSCRDEIGYICSGSPSVCTVKPYCGNQTVETGETCDDGNTIAGDGCSPTCKTE